MKKKNNEELQDLLDLDLDELHDLLEIDLDELHKETEELFNEIANGNLLDDNTFKIL